MSRSPTAPTPKDAKQIFVTLRLGTDEGVEGIGITFFGGAVMSNALKAAIDALGGLTVGENPMKIEKIVGKLRGATGQSGPGGIFHACAFRDRHRAVGYSGAKY